MTGPPFLGSRLFRGVRGIKLNSCNAAEFRSKLDRMAAESLPVLFIAIFPKFTRRQ